MRAVFGFWRGRTSGTGRVCKWEVRDVSVKQSLLSIDREIEGVPLFTSLRVCEIHVFPLCCQSLQCNSSKGLVLSLFSPFLDSESLRHL